MVEESIPYLETLGCNVKTVRPAPLKYPFEKKDDSDYHLGRGMHALVGSTDFEVGMAFSKRKAREILEDSKPHIVECHEPAIPFAAHTLISANPKISENQRLVPFVAVQHAGMPDGGVERVTEFVREILTRTRRPELRSLGRSWTPGWVQTIKGGFSSWTVVSKDTGDFWNKYNPQEYLVIPNGFEAKDFKPEGEKFDEWKKEGQKIIFAAARHDRRKGLDDLLRAHKEIVKSGHNAALKMTGNGVMTDVLKEIVEKEDIPSVEFLGSVSKKDLVKAYRTADVVVAPSIGGEGFNRTIVEGRMSGTLVVCTNINGQRSAIGQELEEFMADPKDPKSLAEKIKKVFDLPKEAAADLREKSRQSAVRDYSWETVSAQKVANYDRVLSEHGEIPVWQGRRRTVFGRIPVMGQIFVNDYDGRYKKVS